MDKQEIIDEIKRTAKLNKGTALGQMRFEKETGIKRSDWFPLHWLRWSDALQEAGLTSNQLNTATSSDVAIEKLVDLIKELGRFPVHGELVIRKMQDATFPHHSVLRKIGNKKKLAEAVVNYCRKHDGLEDVIEICLSYAGKDESTLADDPQTEQANGGGFVYLMKSGRYYKIGRTNSVGRRHNEIKTQMPEAVELVHQIGTDDPSGIEKYWHDRFETKRKNGEWFDLTRADINAFKRRKKFM